MNCVTKLWNKTICGVLACAAILAAGATARADDFLDRVDLAPLQTIACQSNQTTKTADTMARQALELITGNSSLDGRAPLVTMFDMAMRPQLYRDRPLIYITNVPVRKDFQRLQTIDSTEKDRIIKEGTISLSFWRKEEVHDLVMQTMAADARKASALQQVEGQADGLGMLVGDEADFPRLALLPPGSDVHATDPWVSLQQISAAMNNISAAHAGMDGGPMAPADEAPHLSLAGYDPRRLQPVMVDATNLQQAWTASDAATVNQRAEQLAADLPLVRPELYPSSIKRQAEVVYNHLARLTLPGAAFYVLAFIFFLMGLSSGVKWLHSAGLVFMSLALFIHAGGIAIRWWLVGDVFPPIKNEFESVMFSAFFGAIVGLILEVRTRKLGGLFGAAASFVGMLAMLALFAAPFVAGRDIGGEIGQVNGVLMSYWLYIHVTMVTASYALIAIGFVLSAWWLIDYWRLYGTLAPSAWRDGVQYAWDDDAVDKSAQRQPPKIPQRPAGSRGGKSGGQVPAISGDGGAAAVGFWPTMARLLFPGSRTSREAAAPAARSAAPSTAQLLAALDQCNLVVLQLAFCMLGMGIVFGAIWADQSWGRPWGWDPKETFALVTWIVYMIVVHVRVVTTDKGWWTAVLGIVGFFIMLFNWIGVNFWLVGLHSYA